MAAARQAGAGEGCGVGDCAEARREAERARKRAGRNMEEFYKVCVGNRCFRGREVGVRRGWRRRLRPVEF